MGASCITASPNVLETQGGLGDCYTLLIFNTEGSDFLVQDEKDVRSLPAIRIPEFMRPAEQITSDVKNAWGITTVLLWCSRVDGTNNLIAVLEAVNYFRENSSPLTWCPVHQAQSVIGSTEAALIEASHTTAMKVCFGLDPAPFARLGWILRVKDWLGRIVRPYGTELGDFSQINGSETFSLVRFETNKKPLWFKAVGSPNQHEFPITLYLGKVFPAYVPKIVGSDPLFSGWVMESAGDSTLRESADQHSWVKAVERLSQLQIASIPHTRALLEVGCRDRSVRSLRPLIAPFFEIMTVSMAQQTKQDPAPLGNLELQNLASEIEAAINLLEQLEIPPALGHGDCGPGNIVFDDGVCTFIDWAEAYVGCPFLTIEYLLAHSKKLDSRVSPAEPELRETYGRAWASVLSHSTIERAFSASPLVAAFAYAACSQSWRDPERLAVPRVPPYFRSMTRTMKKEADRLSARRTA